MNDYMATNTVKSLVQTLLEMDQGREEGCLRHIHCDYKGQTGCLETGKILR